MNEKLFIEKITPMLRQGSDVVIGPGDDCAVIDIGNTDRYLLYAVDQLISDIHYEYKNTDPIKAGAKLINRNISDIAAMGGLPAHAVVTVAIPNNDIDRIERYYKGLTSEADKWNVSICGGDFAKLKTPKLEVCTLSITGYVDKQKLCLRENAKAGDALYATGRFGDSFMSGHHLDFTPRINEAQFLAGRYTDTMMDVSDGLLIDLGRLTEKSYVTISLELDKILPRTSGLAIKNILSDGEDYELIFTVKPENEKEMNELWQFKDVPLTKIGKVVPFNGMHVIDSESEEDLCSVYDIGWDHFNV
ncbi:MAG TPA: thiamine-phosphate kinase [Victivallales bacterium]|nr:thiamine-phosphate kinase [Victivallales bacterium]